MPCGAGSVADDSVVYAQEVTLPVVDQFHTVVQFNGPDATFLFPLHYAGIGELALGVLGDFYRQHGLGQRSLVVDGPYFGDVAILVELRTKETPL